MAGQLRAFVGSLEQIVAERTRALTTSVAVGRRLSTILDQSRLVLAVVEQVRSAFDYYHVQIYLYNEDGSQLVMVDGTGEAGRALLARNHRLARGQGLVGKAAATNQIVLVPDVSGDPSWLPNALLPETAAEVAVPIAAGGEVLGVLDVQHNVRGGLDQGDAELLQSIANQIAIALQNARLFGSAQRAADREALVNAIGQKIQRAVTVEQVIQVAAEELGQAVRARHAVVQLSAHALSGGPNGHKG
jgi:GAF domain-containing protein